MLTCGQIVAYILLFSSCKIRDYLPNTEKFGVETFSTMRKIRHILLLSPPGIPGHRNVFSHPGLLPCHWVFYNLIYKKKDIMTTSPSEVTFNKSYKNHTDETEKCFNFYSPV